MALRVHYVLVRFPKLSETFVLREMLELERAGWTLAIDTLEDPLDEPRDPGLGKLRAAVRRVPDRPGVAALATAHVRLAARRPGAWVRSATRARREGRFRDFLRAGLVGWRAVRGRADLLHVHFAYYSAEYARDASELSGIPYAVFAHANDIWSDFNAPALPRRLAQAAGVATVTRYNVDHLRSVGPGLRITHLPLGVDVPSGETRRAPGGPLLAVARLVPKKGIDTFIEACALAARSELELRAEVIGSGPLLGELRELAQGRGIAERVLFRGAVRPDEVPAAYARCSAVVAPCRIGPDGDRDGLPTVLLEAMARGVPVIASDLLGIPELIRDGQNGLLVPPDDPEALARAILRLRGDRALAERVGAAGRRTVEERHSSADAAARLRGWLEACARDEAAPPA